MVEKDRLPQNVANTVDQARGIWKTSSSPIKVGGTDDQDQGRSLYSQESGVPGLNSANETDKFNTLCDGVITAHALFDMYLTEILTIKDELLKHPLPSNLLINLTLTCSKLYRSASDLSAPSNELIRLVRLYSAQWEAKSNVLKKLHEDYESKQRRLELALKKLELVGVASEKIEKEKRIMNWEKIFSKVMSAKSHGHRWKFLIKSLKEKVHSGEILSIPFPSNSTDEEPNDRKSEPVIPRHHRRNVKSLRHQSLLRREARNSRSSRTSDEQVVNEAESELSSEDDFLRRRGSSRIRKLANDHEPRMNFTSARFKSKYPFEREGELPRRFRTDRTESPTGVRSINSPKATAPVRRFARKNVSFFDESSEDNKPAVPKKEDKSVWTGEAQYNRFLHIRVFKPSCARVSEPVCTVCFGDQVFSGRVYRAKEDNGETLPETRFEEFMFRLPEGRIYEKGKPVLNAESQELRIAVQNGKGGQMVAMCTVEYKDLKIMKIVNEKKDPAGLSSPEKHPLLSLLSDKETMFNSVIGHVPLECYQSQKERPLFCHQATQTSSIQELFNEMLEARRIEEEKNRIKEEDLEPLKVHTEVEFEELKQKHAEELDRLRVEYEEQFQEIARTFSRRSPDGSSRHQTESKFVSASTSPISMESKSPLPASPNRLQRPRTADARSSVKRAKKVNTSHVLPEWGKDLPANFFDRLEQFSRASAKHRQELSEKTKKAVQENYELQMATQNRLNVTDQEIDLNDVCLPALFMPSRAGTVYSPKANLYFHPSGVSKGRFTQPPSVFKLPCVAGDRSSVMNLFDLSQTFLNSGPSWLSQNRRPRSACSSAAVSQQNGFAVSSSIKPQEPCLPYTKLKSE